MEIIENKNEKCEGLTLEKAKELLGKDTVSDDKLKEVVNAVKVFCKIAYQLFAKQQERQKQQKEKKILQDEDLNFKQAA